MKAVMSIQFACGRSREVEPQDVLRGIGEWTGDASVGRGAVTVAGAVAAVGFAAYRWLRGKLKQRSVIHIDCEPGERVVVQLGDDHGGGKII